MGEESSNYLVIFDKETIEGIAYVLEDFLKKGYTTTFPYGTLILEDLMLGVEEGTLVKPVIDYPVIKSSDGEYLLNSKMVNIRQHNFNCTNQGQDHTLINNQEHLLFVGLDVEYIKYMIEHHEVFENNIPPKIIRMHHLPIGKNINKFDIKIYINTPNIMETINKQSNLTEESNSQVFVYEDIDRDLIRDYVIYRFQSNELIIDRINRNKNTFVLNGDVNVYMHFSTGDFRSDLETLLEFYEEGFEVEYYSNPQLLYDNRPQEYLIEFTKEGIIKRKENGMLKLKPEPQHAIHVN